MKHHHSSASFIFVGILLSSLLTLTYSSELRPHIGGEKPTTCLLFDQISLPAKILGDSKNVQLYVQEEFPLLHYNLVIDDIPVYCGLSESISVPEENKNVMKEFCYSVNTPSPLASDPVNDIGEYLVDEEGEKSIQDPHTLRSHLMSILHNKQMKSSAKRLSGAQCKLTCCQVEKRFLMNSQKNKHPFLEKMQKYNIEKMKQIKTKRNTEEALMQNIYLSYSSSSSILFAPSPTFFSYASSTSPSVSAIYADGTLFLFSKTYSSFSSPPSFNLQLNLTLQNLSLNYDVEELELIPTSASSFKVLLLRTGKYFASSTAGDGTMGRARKTGKFSNLMAILTINQNGNGMSLSSTWKTPYDESFYKNGVVYYLSSLSTTDLTVQSMNVATNEKPWSYALSSLTSSISLASVDDFVFTPGSLIAFTTLNTQKKRQGYPYLDYSKKYFYISFDQPYISASSVLSLPAATKIPVYYPNQTYFFYVSPEESSPYLALASLTPYGSTDVYYIPNVPGFAVSGMSPVYPETGVYLVDGPAPSIFDPTPVGYANLQVQNLTESIDNPDQVFFFHLVDVTQQFSMSISTRVLNIGFFDAKSSFDRSASPQVLHMYGYKRNPTNYLYYEYDYPVAQAALLQPGQFLPPSPPFPSRPGEPNTPPPTPAPTTTTAPTTAAPSTATPSQSTPAPTFSPSNDTIVLTLPPANSPSTASPSTATPTFSPSNDTIVITLPPANTPSTAPPPTSATPTPFSPNNDTIVITLPPVNSPSSAAPSATPTPFSPNNDTIVITLPPATTPSSAPPSTSATPTPFSPNNDTIVITLPPAATPSTAPPSTSATPTPFSPNNDTIVITLPPANSPSTSPSSSTPATNSAAPSSITPSVLPTNPFSPNNDTIVINFPTSPQTNNQTQRVLSEEKGSALSTQTPTSSSTVSHKLLVLLLISTTLALVMII